MLRNSTNLVPSITTGAGVSGQSAVMSSSTPSCPGASWCCPPGDPVALASARPCLEVLRLAAQLTRQNHLGLRQVLTCMIKGAVGCEISAGHEALGVLEGLANALMDVVRAVRYDAKGGGDGLTEDEDDDEGMVDVCKLAGIHSVELTGQAHRADRRPSKRARQGLTQDDDDAISSGGQHGATGGGASQYGGGRGVGRPISGAGGGASSSAAPDAYDHDVHDVHPSTTTAADPTSALSSPPTLLHPTASCQAIVPYTSGVIYGCNARQRSARASVLSDADLLQHVWGFLVDGSAASRGVLGRLGRVCRHWRDVSRREALWRPIAANLLPVVGEDDGAMLKERGTGSWGYLRDYGRSVVEKRVWAVDDWHEDLDLQFELWDALDGLLMLSASGPIETFEMGRCIALAIPPSLSQEVVGPAFSAASRDPMHHRYSSMEEYFERAHEADLPSRLCSRVTVTDQRTGRMALLWESDKPQPFYVEGMHESWEGELPEGSLYVRYKCRPLNSASGRVVSCGFGFHIYPEPGQEGMDGGQKLWRLAGRPKQVDESPFWLYFAADDETVGLFIRSALFQS